MHKKITTYKIALLLSSFSFILGIAREFIVLGILGFSAKNDKLQLYLSIFYTIGLSIDAMRLACLNLYTLLPLSHILFSASLISLPFTLFISLTLCYFAGTFEIQLFLMTLLGSYLNLIAALLITYKQRNNSFLPAQLINVLPNFILIPGILISYWYTKTNLITTIITLTSVIPLIQCSLLLMLPNHSIPSPKSSFSLLASIMTFIRHFYAMIGEQLFQVMIRSAFYDYGTGYLSVFAICIRIYSALRFILIDSFIGSQLAKWDENATEQNYFLTKILNKNALFLVLMLSACMIHLKTNDNLIYFTCQMILILILGFYFSTLVRIIYFKINQQTNDPNTITHFALFEFLFALLAFLAIKNLDSPILLILWLGYLFKPCVQWLFLRKKIE